MYVTSLFSGLTVDGRQCVVRWGCKSAQSQFIHYIEQIWNRKSIRKRVVAGPHPRVTQKPKIIKFNDFFYSWISDITFRFQMVPDSTLSSYFVTLEVPCTRLKTDRPLEVTSTTTSVSKCDQCDQKHSIEETRSKTRNFVHGGLRRCLFSFYGLCKAKGTAVNHQINKKKQI